MWNTYVNAVSTDRVLEILSEERDKARIIAGATDLWLEMERGVCTGIETLIDITRIQGLDKIHVDEKNIVHLGCLTTHNQCAASKIIHKGIYRNRSSNRNCNRCRRGGNISDH